MGMRQRYHRPHLLLHIKHEELQHIFFPKVTGNFWLAFRICGGEEINLIGKERRGNDAVQPHFIREAGSGMAKHVHMYGKSSKM